MSKTIPQLYADVEATRLDLVAAKDKEELARRETTGATNRFNTATKALDAALTEERKKAPWGSEWHAQTVPAHRIAKELSA